MKKAIIAIATLVYIFVFCYNENTANINSNNAEPNTNRLNYGELHSSYEYLMSFDKADLYDDENMTLYSSRKEINEEEIKYYKYDITYIKLIDLMFIDYVYLDEHENAVSDVFNVYAYPFLNESNERDVKLDVYGQVYYSSNYLNKPKRSGPTIKKHKEYDPLPPLYDLLSISNSISTFDEAVGLAYSFVNIPDISVDGPLPYLFYQAKYEIAQADFINNISKTQPTGFINGQSLDDTYGFNEWKFGLALGDWGATISKTGCESIAIYNLLFDSMLNSDNNPHLPSIIALTQLCNADLLLGVFGTLTLPSDITSLISIALQSMYIQLIKPIIEYLIPTLAATILAVYVGITGWLNLFMPGLSEVVLSTITASLLASIATLTPFFDWVVINQHGIGDIIGLLIGNHTYNSYVSLSSFSSGLAAKKQGIFSFWNKMKSDGSGIDILEQLHTVYVKKVDIVNNYIFFNFYCYNNIFCYFNTIESAIESIDSINNTGYAATLFFSGFVMVQ